MVVCRESLVNFVGHAHEGEGEYPLRLDLRHLSPLKSLQEYIHVHKPIEENIVTGHSWEA